MAGARACRATDFDGRDRASARLRAGGARIELDAARTQRRLARRTSRSRPSPTRAPRSRRLAPRPRWILSNGTLAMLEPLVRHAGLAAAARRRAVGRRRRHLQAEPARLSARGGPAAACRPSASASFRRTAGTRSAPRLLASRRSGSTAPAHRSIATDRRRTASSRRSPSSRPLLRERLPSAGDRHRRQGMYWPPLTSITWP